MRARPTSQTGFTLIELMVVLIILGIFTSLMVAEMRGTYEDALLRSTARKIITAANLANSQAVTLNRTHSLILDPGLSRMRVQMLQEGGSSEEENLDSRIKVEVRDFALQSDDNDAEEPRAEREQKQRNLETIQFFPDGTADPREITLRDRTGVELALRINPITGRIRVIESEGTR